MFLPANGKYLCLKCIFFRIYIVPADTIPIYDLITLQLQHFDYALITAFNLRFFILSISFGREKEEEVMNCCHWYARTAYFLIKF